MASLHRDFVGIDISARWFDAHVYSTGQSERFKQTPQGFAKLLEWLLSLGVHSAMFCMEHTGGYESALANWLYERSYTVSLVDGFQVRRFKESLGKRSKTDRLDAEVLARFAFERRPALWHPREDAYEKLYALKRHRDELKEGLTQAKNRLKAPVQDVFVRAQRQAMAELLELQIQAVEEQIRELVQANEPLKQAVEILCSAKSIKFVTAICILAEAGPIQGCPTPESLALAAGVVPLPFQSGTSRTRSRNLPYGNIRLRAALGIIAPVAKRYNPALKVFAQRLEAQGKSQRLINKAVIRKMLHILWGMLISNQPFDENKAITQMKTKRA